MSDCQTVRLSHCHTVRLSECPTVGQFNWQTVRLVDLSHTNCGSYCYFPSTQGILCTRAGHEPNLEIQSYRASLSPSKLLQLAMALIPDSSIQPTAIVGGTKPWRSLADTDMTTLVTEEKQPRFPKHWLFCRSRYDRWWAAPCAPWEARIFCREGILQHCIVWQSTALRFIVLYCAALKTTAASVFALFFKAALLKSSLPYDLLA